MAITMTASGISMFMMKVGPGAGFNRLTLASLTHNPAIKWWSVTCPGRRALTRRVARGAGFEASDIPPIEWTLLIESEVPPHKLIGVVGWLRRTPCLKRTIPAAIPTGPRVPITVTYSAASGFLETTGITGSPSAPQLKFCCEVTAPETKSQAFFIEP